MLRYDKGVTTEIPDEFPAEFPIKLSVNGREIATLVASPHELRFLVAGFLRTQGFVREIGDFLVMGVCDESGEANVRIRGELPERLTPVLTSGCGTGITFTFNAGPPKPASPEVTFSAESIFAGMREMSKLSERYGRHGGIHSAAISDGSRILLHAEDLGRHNTIDRLAGQALFSGVDPAGSLMLTSGRVSSEMAAKAASLGVALIASRTSPTDMAVRICREAGIGLVGYVRGDSFRLAACPERVRISLQPRITGVILAGGESRRMGSNKALLTINGERMVESAYRRMAGLFDEILLITNTPERYDFIPCRKVGDLYPGMGPLAGIHAALTSCATERVFVIACDMPNLKPQVVRMLCSLPGDVVVAGTPGGLEPLHAVYSKSCLPLMEVMLKAGERSILTLLDRADINLIPQARIAELDPDFSSFRNINTPEEYRQLILSGTHTYEQADAAD
ncbi:MAG TPA: formate dehydrogenase accessory sulfurtransferase FdhD [Desulfuromonadales bacterium]|nr:formate dehydrogenase accessory sulfurtransferase FdhD [Desulfuromonadales bacterium]